MDNCLVSRVHKTKALSFQSVAAALVALRPNRLELPATGVLRGKSSPEVNLCAGLHRACALTSSVVSFLPGAYSQTTTSNQPQDVIQSNQTLRTNTRLVVVDVVATDSNGQPVSDLKASDLTVLEDGKPQKISAFSYQREKAATVVAGSASAGAFTNAPQYKNASS